MDLKIYQMGGIDEKSNHLVRKEDKATEIVNMQMDINGKWVKRCGSQTHMNYDKSGAYNESYGYRLIEFRSIGEKLVVGQLADESAGVPADLYKNTGLYRIKSDGSRERIKFWSNSIPMASIFGADAITYAELDNCLYLANNSSGYQFVAKYDGSTYYRAGVNAPDLSTLTGTATRTTSTQRQYAYTVAYIDAQLNISYGPTKYLFQEPAAGDATTLDPALVGGFIVGLFDYYTGVIEIKDLIADFDITAANCKIALSNVEMHDVDVGDSVFFSSFYSVSGKEAFNSGIVHCSECAFDPAIGYPEQIILKVSAITGTHIEFDPTTFPAGLTKITVSKKALINLRYALLCHKDVNNSGVFYLNNVYNFDPNRGGLPVFVSQWPVSVNVNSVVNQYENLIDPLDSRLRPPVCKSVSVFGDQLVFNGISYVFDFNNNLVQYNNDDLIMYSDSGLGARGENVSLLNRQKIGETYDGSIVTSRRLNDSLIIFKTSGLYVIDGILAQGEYSLRKINSMNIGCVSEKSIVNFFDAQLLFASDDGIYATNGVTLTKMSSPIDVTYRSGAIELSSIIGIMDEASDRVLFICNDTTAGACKVLVFDAEYQEWAFWSGIDGRNGAIATGDGKVFFYKVSTLNHKIIELKKSLIQDSGVNIDAYHRTGWLNIKDAAVAKKFEAIRLFSFPSSTSTVSVLVEKDWDEKTVANAEFAGSMTFTTAIKSKHLRFDQKNVRSLRFTFRNNANEDMYLAGYQLEFQDSQGRDKGD